MIRVQLKRPVVTSTSGLVVLLLAFPLWAWLGSSADADDKEISVVGRTITLDDLPKELTHRLPPGTSLNDLKAILLGQPNLILDGATLVVNEPEIGSSRTLMVNTLEFRNGGRIVIGGNNLELDAITLVPDGGGFVGFSADDKRSAASPGQSGSPGLKAGTLVLNARIEENNVVSIRLQGERGQDGGPGIQGPAGVPGVAGENGADHLFDCAHGGGSRGNGTRGTRGKRGKRGSRR